MASPKGGLTALARRGRARLRRAVGTDPATLRRMVDEADDRGAALVDAEGRPNIGATSALTRELEALRLNQRTLAQEAALVLQARRPARRVANPVRVGLASKPPTQADIESEWLAYWCNRLRLEPLYHRKVWEHAYVIQALSEHGVLRYGARVLGFGCGREPIPSLLASLGVRVTASDLSAEDAVEAGWGGDRAGALDELWRPGICSEATFRRQVELRAVDMGAIPEDLTGYDACWSVSALEHLGSLRRGAEFILDSVRTLRPGGVAVHTTQYNFGPGEETIDNWPTVLFRRFHLETIAEKLEARGCSVAPFSFDLGTGFLDRFIDMPPFAPGEGLLDHRWEKLPPAHLRLLVDGFPCTAFGLIVRKDGASR